MDKNIQKECLKHGMRRHRLSKNGEYYRYFCVKCASEAVIKRRKKIKQKAVDYKGGKCKLCGYNKCVSALEFHHKDPTTKEFSIGLNGATRSWNKVKEELDKCILICANCHREVHEGLLWILN